MFNKSELRFLRTIIMGRLRDARQRVTSAHTWKRSREADNLDASKETMRYLEAEVYLTQVERLYNKLDEQLYGSEE
jgi:hypothetical protein